MHDSTDPVLVRRAQIARLVDLGQKIGYSLFLVAIVAFIVTKIDKPTTLMTTTIAVSMAIGSLLLAPAIVFGYGVKAAEREDRRLAAAKAAKVERVAARDAADAAGRTAASGPTGTTTSPDQSA